MLAAILEILLGVEALVVHTVHTESVHAWPYVCLVDILQECSSRITLLRADYSALGRRKLGFVGDARVALTHPTVLGLVVPETASLLVRSLPRILLALWLLGCVDASSGLVVRVTPARRGLLALTEVSRVRGAGAWPIAVHGPTRAPAASREVGRLRRALATCRAAPIGASGTSPLLLLELHHHNLLLVRGPPVVPGSLVRLHGLWALSRGRPLRYQ